MDVTSSAKTTARPLNAIEHSGRIAKELHLHLKMPINVARKLSACGCHIDFLKYSPVEEPRAWVVCHKADSDIVVRVSTNAHDVAARRGVKVVGSRTSTPYNVECVLREVNQPNESVAGVALLTP